MKSCNPEQIISNPVLNWQKGQWQRQSRDDSSFCGDGRHLLIRPETSRVETGEFSAVSCPHEESDLWVQL